MKKNKAHPYSYSSRCIERASSFRPDLREPKAQERGAIVLLAALVILLLVSMIALSIDTARIYSATEEKRISADQVALASLETYFEFDANNPTTTTIPTWAGASSTTVSTGATTTITASTTTVTTNVTDQNIHAQKFSAAVGRAEMIGGQNLLTADGGSQQIKSGDLNTYSTGSGVGGQITSGRWWAEKPASCAGGGISGAGGTSPCPCGNAAVFPCFQACDATAGCANPQETGTSNWKLPFANAMQVILKSHASDNRGIKKVFSRVFGDPDKNIDVTGSASAGTSAATAFAQPKYGVVLFDLGRTMTIDPISSTDMYRMIEKYSPATTPAPMEYAYQLTSAPPGCSDTGSGGNTCAPHACSFVTPTDPGVAAWNPNAYRDGYNTLFSKLTAAGTVDNYRCYNVPAPTGVQPHLVNMGDIEPQPYASLLWAAHELLTTIRDQGNAADRVTFVGFDNDWDEPTVNFRRYPKDPQLSSPPDGVRPPSPFTNGFTDPTHPSYLQISDITHPANRQWRVRNMFFPRTNKYSDITGALNYAYDLIDKELGGRFNNADPYVVLISNGLTQCSYGGSGTGAQTCRAFKPISTGAPTDNSDPSFYNHTVSLQEVINGPVQNLLAPNRIKLNVIFGGSSVAPHSALIRKPLSGGEPPECMEDGDMRRNNYVNFISPTFNEANSGYRDQYFWMGSSLTAPSYLAPGLTLYSATVATRGWFRAIRPPCPHTIDVNGSMYTTVGENYAFQQLCADTGVSTPPSYNSPPSSDPNDAVARTRNSAFQGPAVGVPPTGFPVMDPEGRLMCDPQHQNIAAQTKDFADELMGSRSIYLVN